MERAKRLGLVRESPRLLWGRQRDFPAPRDHGFTDGRTVTVAPKLARAHPRRVLGLLAHELGHVAAIQSGYADHSEDEADALAEVILGLSVGYDAEDVQSAGLRRKRPRYLPR